MCRVKFRTACLCLLGLCALSVRSVRAQVIEPNGLQVPLEASAGETSLQAFFAGQMPPERIDAVADASAEPATFSPLCGFKAELVLSQSSARAGLAWYNVPSDPLAVPTELFAVVEETTMVGATLSSAAIRDDPNYTGGLVGFALIKGGQAIYYSEHTRNRECTACSMPDHWKLMLAYASSEADATYYLAWEDWEGANESSWPNDGDFNDKVFRLSGVRCAGGGEACETGKLGACARGLTECQVKGPVVCKQLESESEELCDAVDNDCDGEVDDQARCESGKVCVRGACVWACGGEEFPCLAGTACDEGLCVDEACVGVRCDSGQTCRAGDCVAPCDAVACPLGQECRGSLCVDPCDGVHCDAGAVCDRGVCVGACNCAGCPADRACDSASGLCVEPGCEGRACAVGSVCQAGECVDACRDARCPSGAACVSGRCTSAEGGPAAGDDPGAETQSTLPGQDGSVPALIPVPSAGSGGSERARARASASTQPRMPTSGCACRALRADPLGGHAATWSLLFGLALACGLVRRIRQRANTRAQGTASLHT